MQKVSINGCDYALRKLITNLLIFVTFKSPVLIIFPSVIEIMIKLLLQVSIHFSIVEIFQNPNELIKVLTFFEFIIYTPRNKKNCLKAAHNI